MGNYAPFSTFGYPQQHSHHVLGENRTVEYDYSGASNIDGLGNSSKPFPAPQEVSTSPSYQQNVRCLLLYKVSIVC